jgi:multiple sugar transport system substrate-binding protein
MRRSWRFLFVLGALALLAACGGREQGPAAAHPSFNWRQFQGTTLRVLLSESHWQQFIAPHLPEFEQLTGITLATEVYPQAKLWDLLEDGLKEPGRVDVFMTLPALDGVRYLRAGGIRPVNDLLRDRTLTAPEYDWEDFFPRARAAMEIEDAILGPPVMAEHLALLYRKDVFKQYQLSVPRTLDELEAAARLLHMKPMGPGGAAGVGIVSRGKGANATSLYAAYLHALGGTWLDGARRPTINGPQSLEALERLGRLLGSYAPPNISEFDWQEASSLFMDGRAAMYLEGSSVFPLLEQSGGSRVSDKVGYAVFPAGPGGPGTTIAVRGLAIARQSANPGAAWLFLQWASSPEMVRLALVGDVLVGRQSAWKDKYNWEGMPPDLVQSFQEAARIGAPDWAPPMVAVTAAREVVGQVIGAAIRGEDFRAAAAIAEKRLVEILRTTEGLQGPPAPAAPQPGRPGAP